MSAAAEERLTPASQRMRTLPLLERRLLEGATRRRSARERSPPEQPTHAASQLRASQRADDRATHDAR
jgi:hypothetical protein